MKYLNTITIVLVTFILVIPVINFSVNENSSCISKLYAENKTIEKNINKSDKTEIKAEEKSAEKVHDKSQLVQASIVIIVIWLGIALMIFKIDRKLKILEKEIDEV